jgi:hypothetical protein
MSGFGYWGAWCMDFCIFYMGACLMGGAFDGGL